MENDFAYHDGDQEVIEISSDDESIINDTTHYPAASGSDSTPSCSSRLNLERWSVSPLPLPGTGIVLFRSGAKYISEVVYLPPLSPPVVSSSCLPTIRPATHLQPLLTLDQANQLIINAEYPDSYYWTPSDSEDDEFYDEADDEDEDLLNDDEDDEDDDEPALNQELMDHLDVHDNQHHQQQQQEEVPMTACVVCLERQPCVTFFGCQHVATCTICVRGMQIVAGGSMLRCPLCNVSSGYIVGRLP